MELGITKKDLGIIKSMIEKSKGVTKKTNMITQLLNLVVGSNVRLAIIYFLYTSKNLTKTDIHNLLQKTGFKMKYKNSSTNIDLLEEYKIVTYSKGERYNRTIVNLNKEQLEKHLDAIERLINGLTEGVKKIK